MQYKLVSVSDKTNVDIICSYFIEKGDKILSTGGTYKYLLDRLPEYRDSIIEVSNVTKFPEILDGRVKTLNPKIFGALLCKYNKDSHLKQLEEHEIPHIDTIIVNLYPFSNTVNKYRDNIDNNNVTDQIHSDLIENIDIGGHSLIRASAKNHEHILTIVDPVDYEDVINNECTNAMKALYGRKAFSHIMEYDVHISNYFNKYLGNMNSNSRVYNKSINLKYGSNPHQPDALISTINNNENPFTVLNGTAGYINMLDAIYSWMLVKEISEAIDRPTTASFKHTAPAGVGTSRELSSLLKQVYGVEDKELTPVATSFVRARNADPMSSFGDFLAISHTVDACTANLIKREVSDGIVAPDYTPEALEILKQKRGGKYLVLQVDRNYVNNEKIEYRELFGVAISQNVNNYKVNKNNIGRIVTTNKDILNTELVENLVIANLCLKYTQSNNVSFSYDGQLIGLGAGQQNRVDCVRLAGERARLWWLRQHPKVLKLNKLFKSEIKRQEKVNAIIRYIQDDFTEIEYNDWVNQFTTEPEKLTLQEKNEFLENNSECCLASDGFFPFRDNIDVASKYKVKNIIQPGGSNMDNVVIETCNKYGINMIFTDNRLFFH